MGGLGSLNLELKTDGVLVWQIRLFLAGPCFSLLFGGNMLGTNLAGGDFQRKASSRKTCVGEYFGLQTLLFVT